MTNGVLVRGRPPQIEAEEPHPGQPVADHELHPRVAEVVLRLEDQRLEHGHGVERRPTALAAIAVAEPLDEPAPEILEINGRLERLQRIAVLAQLLKPLRQPKQ